MRLPRGTMIARGPSVAPPQGTGDRARTRSPEDRGRALRSNRGAGRHSRIKEPRRSEAASSHEITRQGLRRSLEKLFAVEKEASDEARSRKLNFKSKKKGFLPSARLGDSPHFRESKRKITSVFGTGICNAEKRHILSDFVLHSRHREPSLWVIQCIGLFLRQT